MEKSLCFQKSIFQKWRRSHVLCNTKSISMSLHSCQPFFAFYLFLQISPHTARKMRKISFSSRSSSSAEIEVMCRKKYIKLVSVSERDIAFVWGCSEPRFKIWCDKSYARLSHIFFARAHLFTVAQQQERNLQMSRSIKLWVYVTAGIDI